jgi:hypothetical protein
LNYNGKTNDAVFDTLLNIDEEWGRRRWTTPCGITVGIRIRLARLTKCGLNAPTCNAMGFPSQQTMRVRYVKTTRCSSPAEKRFWIVIRKDEYQFSILKGDTAPTP